MKAETKERTMKLFLLSQKHIVYTEPIDVQAGRMVTVFYNPYHTVLNGKPEVWFKCSFNRWNHRKGPLPPKKMVPAENGSHLKATGQSLYSKENLKSTFLHVYSLITQVVKILSDITYFDVFAVVNVN